MDAKYNRIVDNFAVRVALLVLGFSAWAAAAVGLLWV
jgi:hypothetical protein